MIEKKYVVYPGYVTAADKDVHYISHEELMNLYQVKPAECILADGRSEWTRGLTQEYIDTLITLSPRQDGNYVRPS